MVSTLSADKKDSAEATAAVERDDTAPGEGGSRGWLAVTGSAFVYFASFGVINSFGTLQEFYQQEYLSKYSPTAIAFIGTLQIALLYLCGPITGALFDTFGLQYLYPIGAIGSVVSLVALSFTRPQQIWQQFLCQGVLFGLTVSFGAQPALTIVGQYFHKRRALAMGIVAGGSSIGGVCLPIMISRLIAQVGFAWAMRVAGLISLCCYLVAMSISRAKLPPKPLGSFKRLLDFRGFLDLRYTVLAIASFIASLGLYIPYYYIGPYALVHGVSGRLTPYLLPLINGASFFGRIIGGLLADRWGRLNILFPATTLSGVLCLALWLPSRSAAPIFVFVFLYGFCSGIFISVTPSVVGQLCPVEVLGARIGAFFSLVAIATLIGSPIGGIFVGNGTESEYRHLVVFAGCTLTAGGTLLLGARFLCEKRLLAKW